MFKVIFAENVESRLLKWKVKEGSRCGEKVVLCEYINSKVCKLKSEFAGTIKKILIKENEIIHKGDTLALIEKCNHSTVWRNMCADCGADLREEKTLVSSVFVAMEHSIPDLLVSEKNAQELGFEDEKRLLKNRKLVLLVDLDQTIIHTTNDNIPPNLKDVYHFQLHHGPYNQLCWYHTKFRPHTERFLENVSKYFELHICTFGIRPYAHAIANFLDPNKKYFQHRILSRDECFHPTLKTLNLKALFPCGDSMVCIIDDREDVWGSAANMIKVKPYLFFQGTADINAPPGASKASSEHFGKVKTPHFTRNEKIIKVPVATVKNISKVSESTDNTKPDMEVKLTIDGEELKSKAENEISETDGKSSELSSKNIDCDYKEIIEWEDSDDYLVHLETILYKIHKTFYLTYDSLKETETISVNIDLKSIIPGEKIKVLKGCNIIFSGMFPNDQPVESYWAYKLAKSFGAEVHKTFIEGPNGTTHVIGMRDGTEKIKKAYKAGIHVVNINWLLQSTERWEIVEEKLFPIEKNESTKKLPYIPFILSNCKKSVSTTSETNGDSNVIEENKEITTVIDSATKCKEQNSYPISGVRWEKKVLRTKQGVRGKKENVKFVEKKKETLSEFEKDAMLDEIDDELSSNSDLEDLSENKSSILKNSVKNEENICDDDNEDLMSKKLKRKVLGIKALDDNDGDSSESENNDFFENCKSLKRKRGRGDESDISEPESSDVESFIGSISDSDSA